MKDATLPGLIGPETSGNCVSGVIRGYRDSRLTEYSGCRLLGTDEGTSVRLTECIMREAAVGRGDGGWSTLSDVVEDICLLSRVG